MTLQQFLEALRRYFGLPLTETVNTADSYEELRAALFRALRLWPGRPGRPDGDLNVAFTFFDRLVAYQWKPDGPNAAWEIPWQREGDGFAFGAPVAVERVVRYEDMPPKTTMSESKGERFIEQTEQQLNVIVESGDAAGPRRVRGVGITADVINGNKRRYPRAVLAAALADLNSHLHESAGQGRMILTGEAEHPGQKGGRTSILETVVKWEAAALDAAGQVILDGVILPTAKGRDVQVLVDHGVPVGISQRAYGASKIVQENGESVEEVVQLRITGYDLVAEPSDPNGRIVESREQPAGEKKAMTLEELLALLKDKPEMTEALIARLGLADKTKLAEALGVEPGNLAESLKTAKAAQDELAERKRQEAIGAAIVEATKGLAYGDDVNKLFVEAVQAAKPGKAEDVPAIVESKRKEYDGLMSKAKLAQMGKPGGPIIVSTGFEEQTGLPGYLQASHVFTERLIQHGQATARNLKDVSAPGLLYAKQYLEAFDKANRRHLERETALLREMEEAETTADLNLPYSVSRTIIEEVVPSLVAASVFDFGMADGSPTRIYYENYTSETGTQPTIADETYTADHDVWVSLAHKRLIPGTVVVELGGTATAQVEYIDYVVDYANGRIMILSTGGTADAADLDVSYQYDAVREGEMAPIQEGKGTLAYQTIELIADRLATQISDEAITFAQTQLGWDARSRTIGMLIREIREMIDMGMFRLAIAQAHIAANTGGVWTGATDTLDELVEKIGIAAVSIQNDLYRPTSVVMSPANADRLSNWDGYTASGARNVSRQGPGLVGAAGDTGLTVKGLPVFASQQMPDSKILVVNRELVQQRVLTGKTMHLKGPYQSYSGGKLVAAEQWYVEEYNATVSLLPNKGAYVTVA